MEASAINYIRLMTDLPQMIGVTDIQLRLNAVNQERIPELVRALDSGETVDVDLGCGVGEFAATLADRTTRWTIGIDQKPIMPFPIFRESWFREYEEAKKFIYLPFQYDVVLKDWQPMFSWLQGKSVRTYMIMPDPKSPCTEEAELWMKMAVPRGELHIRSEQPFMIERVHSAIKRPVDTIPFFRGAADIQSLFMRESINRNDTIFSCGFRLSGEK